MATHYIVGAGFVGCLFDFGPEPYETKADALEGARFYLQGCDKLTDEDDARILDDLTREGIYYFSAKERRSVAADYIEIGEVDGECPTDEDL